MKNVRLILSVATLVLLVGGYAASQAAVFNGSTEAYAKKIDSPQIQALALILLVGAVALAFVRDPEANGK